MGKAWWRGGWGCESRQAVITSPLPKPPGLARCQFPIPPKPTLCPAAPHHRGRPVGPQPVLLRRSRPSPTPSPTQPPFRSPRASWPSSSRCFSLFFTLRASRQCGGVRSLLLTSSSPSSGAWLVRLLLCCVCVVQSGGGGGDWYFLAYVDSAPASEASGMNQQTPRIPYRLSAAAALAAQLKTWPISKWKASDAFAWMSW